MAPICSGVTSIPCSRREAWNAAGTSPRSSTVVPAMSKTTSWGKFMEVYLAPQRFSLFVDRGDHGGKGLPQRGRRGDRLVPVVARLDFAGCSRVDGQSRVGGSVLCITAAELPDDQVERGHHIEDVPARSGLPKSVARQGRLFAMCVHIELQAIGEMRVI